MEKQEEKKAFRLVDHIVETLGTAYQIIIVASCEKDTYSVIKSEVPFLKACGEQENFAEFAKKLALEILAEDDLQKYPFAADSKEMAMHLKNNDGHYRFEAKDRNPIEPTWYEIKYKLVALEENEEYMVILFSDITEKKSTEKSLQDACIATEIAAKAKADFLSKMTSDLRTPINLMLSMVEMAQNNLNNKEIVNDCLVKMDVSAHYLFHVIDNAIDLALLQNGRFNIDNSPFNIVDLIEELKGQFAEKTAEKNIFFEILIHNNGLDTVIGDAYRLKQILRNLVSNSVKHAEENGTVVIELLLNRIISNRAVFSIIVENDGEQFAEEDFEKLFEAFGNGGNTPTEYKPYKGMGIGLAVCKNTVELLCGTIKASNAKGPRGVRFEVELSFELSEECVPQDIGLISDDAFIRFTGKTIMLVRDEDDDLGNVKPMLENYGIKVEEIYGGFSAISRFENTPVGAFSMIITKMNLSDFSGLNLTESIRRSFYETGGTVPIIGLSGANTEKETMEAINAGMNDFIQLPLDISKVFVMLKTYLV